MGLEAKRTNKERSILDEIFVLIARKSGKAGFASVVIQQIIASLIATRWLAAFGKN